MQAETTTSQRSTDGASSSIRSLDDLAKLTVRELGDLYARGTTPDHLRALDGDLVGRMLAVRGLDRGALFHALGTFARSARFPWAGKSFHATSAKQGTGINRVVFGQRGGRYRLFPFETHIGASVIDGKPCVVLDYDLADNPAFIRSIHDEVREVAPRIFLGPACKKRSDGAPMTVLWFALDARAN
jgi:hypothetical protein